MYTCACRTAQNPCQKPASLMQHCMVAASRVDPWPKLVFSATTDCALHPYVSATYRRPIPRTRKQGRVFARRRRRFFFLGHFCNKNLKYLYRYSIPASAASGGVIIALQAKFFLRFLTFLTKNLMFLMQGEKQQPCMHKPQPSPLQRV